MDSILIFAGAGASKAVAPDRYPTTVEFFESLPDEIRQNPLFENVESFLRAKQTDNITIDIELILWRLQELRDFCFSALDRSQFPGWMFSENRIIGAVQRKNEHLGNFHSICSTGKNQLDELIGLINRRVYDLYSTLPTEEELANNWTLLLKGCKNIFARIEIVTTNYDLIIEEALDINPVVDTGSRGNVVRTLDIDLWTQLDTDKGKLTKLHGSVNWNKKGDKIFISSPNFTGLHENHAIIYPGFKGRPEDAYFLSFHEHFRRSIQSANAIIFIGFAFRDQYINDIFSSAISSNKPTVIVINPQKVKLPFRVKNQFHITKSFDKLGVTECFERLFS